MNGVNEHYSSRRSIRNVESGLSYSFSKNNVEIKCETIRTESISSIVEQAVTFVFMLIVGIRAQGFLFP